MFGLGYVLPDVFHRVELGGFWRQGDDGDVGRHDEARRHVPAGLIDQEHGVRAGRTVWAISTRCRFILSVLQAGGRGGALITGSAMDLKRGVDLAVTP
jgi:hypothetical protein